MEFAMQKVLKKEIMSAKELIQEIDGEVQLCLKLW